MAGDENVLVTKLEARIKDFEKQMIKAEKTAQKTYAQMRKGSTTATKQMANDMDRSTRRINQSLATTSKRVGDFGRAFGGLKGAAVGAVAGILSVRKAFQGAQAAAADFDKIAKTARDTGLDSDFFQALGLAANESSISQEKLNAALVVFTKNSGLAASGQGTLYTQLKKMNPELLKAFQSTSSQEERLRILADATARASTATERAALATTAFGRTGVELTRVLVGGSSAFDDVAKRARELGIVIDKELLNSAEELETKFGVASQVLRINMQQALIELMPLMTETARLAGAMAKNINGIVQATKSLEDRRGSTLQKDLKRLEALAEFYKQGPRYERTLQGIDTIKGEMRSRAATQLNENMSSGSALGSGFNRDSWLGNTNAVLEQEVIIRDKITTSINNQGSALDLLAGYTGNSLDQFDQLTEQQTVLNDVGRDAFSTLIGGLRAGESFTVSLNKALDSVLDKLAQIAADSLFSGGGISSFISSVLGSGGGFSTESNAGSVAAGASGVTLGALYHSGGVVGASGGASRAVASSVFNGAPRYHGGGVAGLKPNEVPAILERGETIIPKGGSASGYSRPVEVHVTMGISADSAGNMTPYIEQVSSEQAVKVVQQAAPAIVNASVKQSVDASGAALGSGKHDKAMARFGARPKAVQR